MKSNPLSLEEVSERPMRFTSHCLQINFGVTAICDLAQKILKLVRKTKKAVSNYKPIQLLNLESNSEIVKNEVINEKLTAFYFVL